MFRRLAQRWQGRQSHAMQSNLTMKYPREPTYIGHVFGPIIRYIIEILMQHGILVVKPSSEPPLCTLFNQKLHLCLMLCHVRVRYYAIHLLLLFLFCYYYHRTIAIILLLLVTISGLCGRGCLVCPHCQPQSAYSRLFCDAVKNTKTTRTHKMVAELLSMAIYR